MARILGLPDIKEKILGLGGEAKWKSPEGFDRMIRSGIAPRAKVLKTAGN